MKTYFILSFGIFLTTYCNAQNYPTIKEVFDFEVADEFHYIWTESNTPGGYKYRILAKRLSLSQDTLSYVRERTAYSSELLTQPINHFRFSFQKTTDTIYYTNLDSGIHYYYTVKQSDSIHLVQDTNYLSPEFWNQRIYLYELRTNPNFEPTISTMTHIKGFGQVNWGYSQVASNMILGYKLIYARKQGIDYGNPDAYYLKNNVSDSHQEIEFQCYPNPVNQLLFFQSLPENLQQITIRSLTGSAYKTYKEKEWLEPIDLTYLPSGMYILELHSDQTSYIKLIKQ